MLKVLIVDDDFAELTMVESLLRKIGVDTVGIQNEMKVSEELVSFRPQLIIAAAVGSKVNGIQLSHKVRRTKGIPRLALIVPGDFNPSLLKGAIIDALIERPIFAVKLIRLVAQVGHLDEKTLLEKYERISGMNRVIDQGVSKQPPLAQVPFVQGSSSQEPTNNRDRVRVEKYKDLLKGIERPIVDRFTRDKVHASLREERAEITAQEKAQLDELDQLKREFVCALVSLNHDEAI